MLNDLLRHTEVTIQDNLHNNNLHIQLVEWLVLNDLLRHTEVTIQDNLHNNKLHIPIGRMACAKRFTETY